jgi:ATP-dependent exoDNAse (exonuclease V) beta subunit
VIEKALNAMRIPSVIFGGTRFWDRKEIKDILSYLRLLANEKDDAAHLRVINTPPRAIGKTSVETVLSRVRNGEGTFWQVLLAEANGAGRAAPKLKVFTDLIQSWKELLKAGETPLPILAERIIADTGYKEFLRKDDELTADERIANIDEMVNAIREFDEDHQDATLDAFLQDISLLTDADKKVDDSKGAVTLMTIHMAKGLEFNTVHIAGCDDGIFPLIRETSMLSPKEGREQLEEERRLFYVGCTRAEKNFICTMRNAVSSRGQSVRLRRRGSSRNSTRRWWNLRRASIRARTIPTYLLPDCVITSLRRWDPVLVVSAVPLRCRPPYARTTSALSTAIPSRLRPPSPLSRAARASCTTSIARIRIIRECAYAISSMEWVRLSVAAGLATMPAWTCASTAIMP